MRLSIVPRFLFIALGLVLVTGLGACGGKSATSKGNDPAEPLRVSDMWVRAVDDGMSAAFGVLHNDGDTPVVVTAVSSTASDDVQLHETVDEDGKTPLMRESKKGFAVKAGSSLLLEPGGNHIMLMGVHHPLLAGEEVEFTLTLADGRTFTFTAPVKDFEGGAEDYESHGFDDPHAHLDEHADH